MEDKLNKAIQDAHDKLSSLSFDEFHNKLNNRTLGDIAGIILETGSLDVGSIEAKSFEFNNANEKDKIVYAALSAAISFQSKMFSFEITTNIQSSSYSSRTNNLDELSQLIYISGISTKLDSLSSDYYTSIPMIKNSFFSNMFRLNKRHNFSEIECQAI